MTQKRSKTKPINSKESVDILRRLMGFIGYGDKEINKFIKKHKIGKEKIK